MRVATLAAVGLTLAAPAAVETRRQAAVSALVGEANAAADDARFADSLKLADQAIALAERTLARRDPRRFEAVRRRAVTMTYLDQGAAPAAYDRLGQVADEVYGAASFEARFVRFKGAQWKQSARVPGFGLPQLSAAVDAVVAVAAGDEQVTLAAQAMATLASLTSLTDIAAARPIAARAVALADSRPDVVAAERGQAYAFCATVALRDDRPADALALARKAERVYVADQGANSHHLLGALGTQASAAKRMGDTTLAETTLRRALAIVDARPQLGPAYTTTVLMDYAQAMVDRGRYDLAFPIAERAVAAVAKVPPTANLAQATMIRVGRIYQTAGEHDEALRHFRRALTVTEQAKDVGLYQATVLTEMGRSEFALGDLAAAQATAERALAVYGTLKQDQLSARGRTRMLLADLADARGDTASAAALYAQAATELRGVGPDPVNTAAPRIRHAAMLARGGRLDDASWREARAAGDALIGTVGRQAGTRAGDGVTLAIPPALLDGALDVAWAQAHPVQVGAR